MSQDTTRKLKQKTAKMLTQNDYYSGSNTTASGGLYSQRKSEQDFSNELSCDNTKNLVCKRKKYHQDNVQYKICTEFTCGGEHQFKLFCEKCKNPELKENHNSVTIQQFLAQIKDEISQQEFKILARDNTSFKGIGNLVQDFREMADYCSEIANQLESLQKQNTKQLNQNRKIFANLNTQFKASRNIIPINQALQELLNYGSINREGQFKFNNFQKWEEQEMQLTKFYRNIQSETIQIRGLIKGLHKSILKNADNSTSNKWSFTQTIEQEKELLIVEETKGTFINWMNLIQEPRDNVIVSDIEFVSKSAFYDFQILEMNGNADHFYLGIFNQENNQAEYSCLCCGDKSKNMNILVDKPENYFKEFAKFRVKLNVPSQELYVLHLSEQKQTEIVKWQGDIPNNKQKRFKFFLSWMMKGNLKIKINDCHIVD